MIREDSRKNLVVKSMRTLYNINMLRIINERNVACMRVYLDNCSFNRPFDNQNAVKIKIETQAKLYVQHLVLEKKLDLAWSFILEYENDKNPFEERRIRIAKWQDLAVVDCDENEEILEKAAALMKEGLHQKDALHVASAIFLMLIIL